MNIWIRRPELKNPPPGTEKVRTILLKTYSQEELTGMDLARFNQVVGVAWDEYVRIELEKCTEESRDPNTKTYTLEEVFANAHSVLKHPPKIKTKPVTLELPENLYEVVNAICEETGTDINTVISEYLVSLVYGTVN